jgi:hypothetical protein
MTDPGVRYRYMILWYGPPIQLDDVSGIPERTWRQVAMLEPWVRVRALGVLLKRESGFLSGRPNERYMVVPLDDDRRPETFTLRAHYTAEPA